LGREGVLPAQLGRTHPRFRSPHIASTAQSVISAILVLIFAITMGTKDPTNQAYLGLYGLMALLGTSLVLIAQAIVSVAIVVYFLFSNIDFLGGGLSFAHHIWWIDLIVIGIGIGGALWLKSARPKVYDDIGRLIYQGLDK